MTAASWHLRFPPWVLVLAGLPGFMAATPARSDQETSTAPNGNPNRRVTARADLDFVVNIGKFIFFRIGTGAFPTASGTSDTVSFNIAPSLAGGSGALTNGNDMMVSWDGALPGFAVISTNAVLPVEVRSNAGQVSIRASVISPLVSGASSIPMSQVVVTSSDGNLPAPPVPDSGTGSAANVAGTAFSSLVTVRSANWTFGYNPTAIPSAGAYSGQISFTASSP